MIPAKIVETVRLYTVEIQAPKLVFRSGKERTRRFLPGLE